MTQRFNTGNNQDTSFAGWIRNSDTITSLAIFAVALVITAWELLNIGRVYQGFIDNWGLGIFEGIFGTIGVLVAPAMFVVVGYKGIIQAWSDWKNNRTR